MPWTKTNYPDSMKNLPVAIRNKAIEISNAILEEGSLEEGKAIATGIKKAEEWGKKNGKRTTPLKNSKK